MIKRHSPSAGGALNTAIPSSVVDDSVWDILERLDDIVQHETKLFPNDTNLTCTLTALATANTFSAWAEIEDNTGGTTLKLSTAFATIAGHITGLVLESVSQDDTIYEVEIAYGSDKGIVTRWRFAGATKFINASHQIEAKGAHIPAGETVYYRMKTATAVADTAVVHFRYFNHS